MKDPLEEAREQLAQLAEAERGWETYRQTGGDKQLARQRVMAARELAERAAPRLLKELCDELEPARVELRLRRALDEARDKYDVTHQAWQTAINKMDDPQETDTSDKIEALRDAESETRHADWAAQDVVKEAKAALEALNKR